ncbi:MAG TPA: EAL domain-containing protein [Sphingobium sp.]
MRPKIGLKTATILVACLCMIVPVATALILVDRQETRAEDAYILQYARSVLARSERSADQIDAAAREINAIPPASPCSDDALRLMQRLDLRSTMLQGVGYAEGDELLCSSFAGRTPVPIGKPDLVTRNGGVLVRTHVRLFPHDPDYLVIVTGRAAAVVHKQLTLSFVERVPGLALSTFEWRTKRPLTQMGELDPAWFRAAVTHERVLRQDGHLIAVVRSQRRDMGAIAALSTASTPDLAWQASVILLPIGLVTGVVFAVLMIHVVRSRLSLPSLIQIGLRRNEFSLVFQPVVDLATGRIVAAEVLMRWRRHDGEIVPPDVFITAAEDAGMIRLLTARLIERLREDVGAFSALPADFAFAINLSADDLHTPATVEALRRLLRDAEPGLQNLVVELTERSLVDVEQARSVIEQIRSLGVRVAIDDFGTGYCSLSYIAQLKVDFIKIDKLFVHALGTDSPTSSVAGLVIELARDLDLHTVAEGIETEEQAGMLRSLGVDFGQGWVFGAPMTLEDLLVQVRAERTAILHKAVAA